MKRIFAMLCLFPLEFSFAACGTEPAGTDDSLHTSSEISTGSLTGDSSVTDTEGSSESSADTEEVWEPVHAVDNLFLAGDQYHQDVLVYDLDQLEPGDDLDDAVVWSHHVGISHIAGLKYRTDTVFGDVILVAAGATKGKAQMISYPDGEVLWSTDEAGDNPHCIEILPSGNIVVAASTGGTLRTFRTAALLEEDEDTAATYSEVPLYSAHGVLYDPEYNLLWGLGNDGLLAYNITGSGSEQTLVRNDAMTVTFPSGKRSGHALAPDLTDPDFLYVSVNEGCMRFDKTTRKFTTSFKGNMVVNKKAVKGLSHNQNGNFCLAIPNGGEGTAWVNMGYGSWCTDTLTFCFPKSKTQYDAQTYTSSKGSAFYKVVAFNGAYL